MDFVQHSITGKNPPAFVEHFLLRYYGISPDPHTWYGLNLGWGEFDIEPGHDRYFLSWHTEYFDKDWFTRQVLRLGNRPIVLVTDYPINDHAWSDNVTTVTQVTMHHQLDLMARTYGLESDPKMPQFKISSLSNRVAQYKKFVTAYLLANVDPSSMILTWNNLRNKSQDLHDVPNSHAHLRELAAPDEPVNINWYDPPPAKFTPLIAGDWHLPPYQQALVNLTNESYHYSWTHWQGRYCLNAGPYLTEKTWKPICAGRPFVPVGQSGSAKWLADFGFNLDFGFDLSFDSDSGDLSRIQGVFDTLRQIERISISDLFESSLHSVKHNCRHIASGDLWSICQNYNNSTKHLLQ